MADVNDQMAGWDPKSKAHNIGSLYAHIVQGEDMAINGMLQGKPTLWQQDRWDKKLNIAFNGMQQPEPRIMNVNLAAMKPYVEAVTKATDAYLAGLKPADLDYKLTIGGPIGEQTLAWCLQVMLAGNIRAHTGEISALKGRLGPQGLPVLAWASLAKESGRAEGAA
ncbi:MAG: DinB family protein [Dehalococcoidia bacterium]|nr:DinB family protein [Dehalococcoidia bacterium]